MKLVDYDDSDEEEQPKVKTLNLQDLANLSKKIKGNDSQAIRVDISEEDSDPHEVEQIKSTNKFQMTLSKPKNKVQSAPTRQIRRGHVLPPPPPGVNYVQAEKFATSEDQAMIQQFDGDDEFMQDQQTLMKQGRTNVTFEDGQVDGGQHVKMMKIHEGSDKYWQLERDKLLQKQEVYMHAPLDMPSSVKQEKNQIDSLYYQAALKEEQYEIRKQDQKSHQIKGKQRYGW